LRPLVERYLGALPSAGRKETGKDVGVRPPTGVIDKQVVKGIDPKSEVSVVYTGPFQNTPMNRLVMRVMGEMLQGNLHQALREEMGGTYGVGVSSAYDKRPADFYRVTVDFSCDPARTDALVARMFQEIDRFRNNGPSQGQIADAKLALSRDFEVNSRDNRYLLNQITYKYQYGEDVADVFDMSRYYNQLSVALIRDAARTYLDTGRYVKVVLRPAR
jgi:zinc protease